MKNSVKTVVAIGIGAALFFVLGRFVIIPTGIPNTNINIQYAVLSVFAGIFGPIAGALIGFIGHALIDLTAYGSPWWSWVIASALVGAVNGLIWKKVGIADGSFSGKKIVLFILTALAAHLIAWVGLAPVLDIVMYAEPVDKIFVQGLVAAAGNFVTTAIIGTLLALAYTKTIAGKGTLEKE